jgi:hypothetical protein
MATPIQIVLQRELNPGRLCHAGNASLLDGDRGAKIVSNKAGKHTEITITWQYMLACN